MLRLLACRGPGRRCAAAVIGTAVGAGCLAGQGEAHASPRTHLSPTEKLFRLDGRVALVTGSSRGIGFAMAAGLSDLGAHVVLNGTNPDTLSAARQKLLERDPAAHCSTIAFNVSDPAACEAAVTQVVKEHGHIDILVNNAGINRRSPAIEMSITDFQHVLECNLLGPFALSRACAIHMRRQKWGRIVNVGSIMGNIGRTGLGSYVSSKHALLGLTKVMAAELGCEGITVNCIAPGYIATDLTKGLQEDSPFNTAVCDRNPIGRWGQTIDLVGPLVLLASSASSYVNGAVLVVDGGFTETFHIGGAEWRGAGAPAAATKA